MGYTQLYIYYISYYEQKFFLKSHLFGAWINFIILQNSLYTKVFINLISISWFTKGRSWV